MYKIGEFSKLCKLSVKTLRYYADIGLLEPEFIDDFTGYRYYSVKQLQEVARIQALKEMGFSLEEIQRSNEDTAQLIEKKEQEIRVQIQELDKKLKRLAASRQRLQKEDLPMFHVNVKTQERIKVESVRQVFANREEALVLMKCQLAKRGGTQAIIVNYENEFQQENLDLEIAFPDASGTRELLRGVEIPGYESSEPQLVASVICDRASLDDAYSYLIRYVCEELEYQIVGDAHEWYLDADTIELQLPVHKLEAWKEIPENDDINIPFENDEAVLGYWRVIQSGITKDGFNPEHCNWKPMDGDIEEIYFLPEGERYWCFGWTKGALLSRFSVPIVEGVNPYKIETIQGKPYLFVWFKHHACFHRNALPSLLVLEQVDNKSYSKEDIRVRDEMTTDYDEDETVLGKWQVCDFIRTPELFRHGEYNADFPKEKLFFKKVSFEKGGKCQVQYGEEIMSSPWVDWSRGYVREQGHSLMQKYERRIIEGTEYLFVEFKSGDYYYNHQKPWWYVFTRVVEK